jgi:hypothetical protein
VLLPNAGMAGEAPPSTGGLSASSLAISHRNQRLKLQASLESSAAFRAGTLSPHLLGLMHREEDAMVGEGPSRSLVGRIDSLLASETENHFRGQCRIRLQKWQSLLGRQSAERLHVPGARSVLAQGEEKPPSSARLERCPREVAPGSLTAEQFRAQEALVRKRTNEAWGETERYAVESAIDLQLERLEADWGVHEERLRLEYDACRSQSSTRAPGATSSKKRDQRWHGREKQSRLIHTAPVFTPDGAGAAAPTGKVSDRLLDSAYSAALEQLLLQKRNAKQWLKRQKIRLVAQINVLCDEKLVVGKWITEAVAEEQRLRESLQAMVDKSWEDVNHRLGAGKAKTPPTSTSSYLSIRMEAQEARRESQYQLPLENSGARNREKATQEDVGCSSRWRSIRVTA